ncbi:citrate transporter [Desulfitobacterium metallireducens DSM 15288]|uniref:Citrate transporter n=2 Tax=Desulfitobacterium TaxID=36853 RepID=W0ECQ5_9FIRM|nr:citrate transporter [Desulfitobacterium metallireducens DSM 15288]
MIISATLLSIVLVIFTLGKSPIFRVDRAGAAIIGATLTIATGVLSFDEAISAVDYRTIILLFSMMLISSYMNAIGLFDFLGHYIMKRLRTPKGLLIVVIIMAGLLSALLINDIVCLFFTPVVITVTRRAKLSSIPYLIAVALASNIGSAATLIGNPQNILIGSLSHLSFSWYLLLALPISLIGLFLTYIVLAKIYTKELSQTLVLPSESVRVKPIPRFLLLKGIVTLLGVILSFLFGLDPALVASLGAAILLITRRLKPNKVYAGIDYNLLVIFIGLFVVVGGVEKSGLLNMLLGTMKEVSLPVFMILTVILSNIVSNVPAVMLLKFMIPPEQNSIWWANIAIFSTLAGNLTITGSIANLIVVELAKKNGIHIRFFDYLRIGFPITIILVLIGMLYFKMLFGI